MARRQEQEGAQREISEVAPGVLRMQLPISMPGLGHVNMYALLDDRGAAVVDPGLPGPATWRAIQDRLKQADLKVKDVHTVLVTHSHPDHFGGAARFAKEAGAEVVAHEAFRFGVEAASDTPEVSVEDLEAQHPSSPAATARDSREVEHENATAAIQRWQGSTPWGGKHPRPPFKTRIKWRVMRALGRAFIPAVTKTIRGGDTITLAGREWRVVHTPGHTEDHFCLHDADEGVFLAGDHVLPTITPHISGISIQHDPLDAFFESLEKVGAIPGVRQCLPAHGHPFSDLKARTEAIREHHIERLERVKSIGRALGPATVEAFSQQLFRQRNWGSMAESETYAHLEHLRHGGEAACHRDLKGLAIYETG